jgi:hypothetical protein
MGRKKKINKPEIKVIDTNKVEIISDSGTEIYNVSNNNLNKEEEIIVPAIEDTKALEKEIKELKESLEACEKRNSLLVEAKAKADEDIKQRDNKISDLLKENKEIKDNFVSKSEISKSFFGKLYLKFN